MTESASSCLKKKPFYFLRHGETDWNAKHVAMGLTDIPLNANGRAQSQAAIDQLKDLEIATICHSPLQRARQTAEILNEVLHCPMHPIDELKEFNLGENAGRVNAVRVLGKWFDAWMDGQEIPGAETFEAFVARALVGVNRALEDTGPLLIVAHGGIYWALQRAIGELQLPDLPNCVLASFTPSDLDKPWRCSHFPDTDTDQYSKERVRV